MFAILGLIPTILTTLTGLGNSGSSIASSISNWQIAKEKTKSDAEIKKIDAEILALHDRKDVMVAEAGSRMNGLLRFILAIGPACYVFKYFFFDKVIGSMFLCSKGINDTLAYCQIFRTDGLTTDMVALLGAVASFYLLTTWKPKA